MLQAAHLYDPYAGSLRILTEFGILEIAPCEIAVIGRGMRFAVELLQGSLGNSTPSPSRPSSLDSVASQPALSRSSDGAHAWHPQHPQMPALSGSSAGAHAWHPQHSQAPALRGLLWPSIINTSPRVLCAWWADACKFCRLPPPSCQMMLYEHSPERSATPPHPGSGHGHFRQVCEREVPVAA